MERKVVALLVFTAFAASAAPSHNVAKLQKSLNSWEPISIIEDNNVITITMKEAKITPEFYDMIAPNGVCSALWMDTPKSTLFQGIKEIRVLNKFNAFGYVLEAPRNTCKEVGDAQPNESKVLILSKTHLYMGK